MQISSGSGIDHLNVLSGTNVNSTQAPVKSGAPQKVDSQVAPKSSEVLHNNAEIQAQKDGKLLAKSSESSSTGLSQGLNVGHKSGAPVGQKVPGSISSTSMLSITGGLQDLEDEQAIDQSGHEIPVPKDIESCISKFVGDKMDLSKPNVNIFFCLARAIYNFFAHFSRETTTLGQDEFIRRTNDFITAQPQILVFLNKVNLKGDGLKQFLQDMIKASNGKDGISAKDAALYADTMSKIIARAQTPEVKEMSGKISSLADDFLAPFQKLMKDYSGKLEINENGDLIGYREFYAHGRDGDKVMANFVDDFKQAFGTMLQVMENDESGLLRLISSSGPKWPGEVKDNSTSSDVLDNMIMNYLHNSDLDPKQQLLQSLIIELIIFSGQMYGGDFKSPGNAIKIQQLFVNSREGQIPKYNDAFNMMLRAFQDTINDRHSHW